MHFSRLALNTRSRAVRRDLGNPYELHRTLMRAFPDQQSDGPGRVLWRTETDRQTYLTEVLVQSDKPANWQSLLDEWPDYVAHHVRAIETKEAVLSFSEGQVLVFRLRANPTVKRDNKRHGYFKEEDQLAWLQRKAAASGATLLDTRVRSENSVQARRPNSTPMTFLSVLFEGRLQVQQPEQLLQSVSNGIGSAKGFGFGLLSLARA